MKIYAFIIGLALISASASASETTTDKLPSYISILFSSDACVRGPLVLTGPSGKEEVRIADGAYICANVNRTLREPGALQLDVNNSARTDDAKMMSIGDLNNLNQSYSIGAETKK